MLGAFIGSITFTGSLIAGGKLQGLIPGKPIFLPGGRFITVALAVVAVLGTVALIAGAAGAITLSSEVTLVVLGLVVLSGLIFGITMVLPIGGADMPVVISLLNSFTGTAAAMAGFVLGNPVLIISGALVGASGAILTKLMADAMNRSVMNIMVGGFGGGDDAAGAAAGAGGTVREIGADDVAIQLAYAQHVIIVPGYGLAVAQAQHAVRELAELLEERGVDVKYAIHPVAGRMPGHMNVLLAEANVPYPQLKEMDDINPEFDRADVALVIGANDVTNPAARRPGSPVSGMPILDVDHAKSIVVIKRSMGKGYAGIDNELYSDPKTGMLFADAKDGLAALDGGGQGALASAPQPGATPYAAGMATQPTWPRPAKIAFIGSHGIRKTSALLAFAAEAQRAGRSVELGREVVRDNPLGINEGATGEAQLWVLVTQIRQELELARRADILATDRGVMDNFAYYLRSCGGDGRVRRRSRWCGAGRRPTTSSCGSCPTSRSRPTACAPRTTRSATRSRRSSTTCCPASSRPTGWSRSGRPRSRAGSTGSACCSGWRRPIGATVVAPDLWR